MTDKDEHFGLKISRIFVDLLLPSLLRKTLAKKMAETSTKKRFTLSKKQDRVKAVKNAEMQIPVLQAGEAVEIAKPRRNPVKKRRPPTIGDSERKITELCQLIAAHFIISKVNVTTPSHLGASIRQIHRKLTRNSLELCPLPDHQLFKTIKGVSEFHFQHPRNGSPCKVWRDDSFGDWHFVEQDEQATENLTFIHVPIEMVDGISGSSKELIASEIELISEQIESSLKLTPNATVTTDSVEDHESIPDTSIPTYSVSSNNTLSESTCLGLCEFYSVYVKPLILTDTRSSFLSRLNSILNNALKNIPYPHQSNNRAPFVTVQFFGSSVNNLGFKTSDADLCIIPNDPTAPDHPYSNMNRVAKVLRKHYSNIIPIKGARVPIVKFFDPITKMECDINFNHSLGVANSALLASYTHLDARVQPLIMLIKLFVKRRQINDASLDTISSYAYTLMVIFECTHALANNHTRRFHFYNIEESFPTCKENTLARETWFWYLKST